MTDSTDAIEPTSIFDAHPMLGKYQAHYTCNRARLMMIAGVIYAFGVFILQVMFANVDDATASIFLPLMFAGMALPLAWYVMHLWNREIILYEDGFSYREGSNQAFFVYQNILSFMQSGQRLRLFGVIPYDHYDARLLTDQDELLRVTNVYGQPGDLIEALEKQITRARLPIIRQQLLEGETIRFHENLALTAKGIHIGDADFLWQDYQGYQLSKGQLQVRATPSHDYAVPLKEIDNLRLLITLLRENLPDTPTVPVK